MLNIIEVKTSLILKTYYWIIFSSFSNFKELSCCAYLAFDISTSNLILVALTVEKVLDEQIKKSIIKAVHLVLKWWRTLV